MINWLIVWSIKQNKKKAYLNFPLLKVMSSNGVFYPTNGVKTKDFSFTIINDKEKKTNSHI